MPLRVGVVQSAGDDSDGRCAGTARALVGRTVDSQRETRHDADAGGGQVGAELRRHADAVAGRRTCPHQCHGRSAAQRGRVAQAEQERRRPRVVGQPGRERRSPGQEDPDAELGVAFPAARRRPPGTPSIRRRPAPRPPRAGQPPTGRAGATGPRRAGMPTRPRRPPRAGPAADAHGTTAARPARSDRASDAWANDTSRAPARAATVRATRDTLCSPRALRAPERSFAARSAAASGASSGSPALGGRCRHGRRPRDGRPRPTAPPADRTAARRDPGG